jgi:hypothetical protein
MKISKQDVVDQENGHHVDAEALLIALEVYARVVVIHVGLVLTMRHKREPKVNLILKQVAQIDHKARHNHRPSDTSELLLGNALQKRRVVSTNEHVAIDRYQNAGDVRAHFQALAIVGQAHNLKVLRNLIAVDRGAEKNCPESARRC